MMPDSETGLGCRRRPDFHAVVTIHIPRLLAETVAGGRRHNERRRWLAGLPDLVAAQAAEWELRLGAPYEPGGSTAWIAPALGSAGEQLVLKIGWRHFEAEHEAEALRLWEGNGAVRCLDARRLPDSVALLLERCRPGVQLALELSEPEQDLVIARLLRRLWVGPGASLGSFRPLEALCAYWAEGFEAELDAVADAGLAREALVLLRELPASARERVLLCTDLHAENVLSAQREPWLAIDPKPFVGDPAFDPVQHMLNCRQRLASDPRGLAARMAELLDLDGERVRLWLFVRCAQEGLHDAAMREAAQRLAA